MEVALVEGLAGAVQPLLVQDSDDDAARNQVASAREAKAHDTAALQSLLRGKDTWTVD